MYGDSESDLDAARAFGLDFVFVRGKTEWHEGDDRCRDLGCKVVENFSAWDSWTLSA